MSSAKRAIGTLCFSNMDVLMNSRSHNNDVNSMLSKRAILELDGLSAADRSFFSSSLLLYIFYMRMADPERGGIKNCVIFEEAHNLLSGLRAGPLKGVQTIDKVFAEAREFGLALIVIDQSPSQLTPSAISNLFYLLSFNLRSIADQRAIANAMDLPEGKKLLANLSVGQGIVSVAGRGVPNFMIRIPMFKLPEKVMSDMDIIRHMTGLGLYSVRDHPKQAPPSPQAVAPASVEDGISPVERAFLKDILKYPECGVVERYRRLGLSARIGNKFKNYLIAKGLIEARAETTRMGRTRVLKLTETGQEALGTSDEHRKI